MVVWAPRFFVRARSDDSSTSTWAHVPRGGDTLAASRLFPTDPRDRSGEILLSRLRHPMWIARDPRRWQHREQRFLSRLGKTRTIALLRRHHPMRSRSTLWTDPDLAGIRARARRSSARFFVSRSPRLSARCGTTRGSDVVIDLASLSLEGHSCSAAFASGR